MKLSLAALALIGITTPSMAFGIGESITLTKACPHLVTYFEDSAEQGEYDPWTAGQCFGYLAATLEAIYIQNPDQICADYRTLADGTRQRILTNEIAVAVVRYLDRIEPTSTERSQVLLLKALEANFPCKAADN